MIVGERGEEEGEEPDSLTKQFEMGAFCLKTMHEFFKGIKKKSHHIISKHLWQLEMWERAQQQGVLWWRQFYLQINCVSLVSEVWMVFIQPIWLFSFTWNGNCHDDHIQKEQLSAKVSECRQSSMSLSINISTHGTLSHCLWLLSLAHIVFQDSPFLLELVHLRWPRAKGGSYPPPS